MDWIVSNLATIIIGLLVLSAVILAICSVVKAHGNGQCGAGCAGCSCSGRCSHTE